MKYFLDTEFIEYPCTIDLISIAIVAEDGREYYAHSAMDFPKGFPMYCRDIKQLADSLGNPKLPDQEQEHDALSDAKWNKKAFDFLGVRQP